jgi:sugar phosphate isomerase/epimerase
MTTNAISRRSFTKGTLGALGGLTLGSVSALHAEKARSSVFGGLQIGVMTYSFRDRPLEKALKNIVDIGISSVELYSGHLDPLKATDQEIQSWKNKFADAGVKLASYYVEMGDNPTEEQIDRCFEGGRLIGVNVLTTPSSFRIPRTLTRCSRALRLGSVSHST